MFAPSIRWQPTPDTDVVLTGLYQEDDTGSTSQFLPIVGTFRPNPANPGGRLDPYTFVGKAGWDRYNGRSLQGGGRSEEHTSELQSLMRISYAVFCLQKKKQQHIHHEHI